MSIRVTCPGCGKKFNAKDEMAGERVKCKICGHKILVPAMQSKATVDMALHRLSEAMDSDDPAQIGKVMFGMSFTLVAVPDESNDDGETSALVAEVDEMELVVAFTSDKYVKEFAKSKPEMLDEDESLPTFEVLGSTLVTNLPEECGVLLNPESDDCYVLQPNLFQDINRLELSTEWDHTADGERENASNSQAESLKNDVFEYLESRGFSPAPSLPMPEIDREVRPQSEIAARLMALGAVFIWASAPESAVESEKVLQYAKVNGLGDWLTAEESDIIGLPRKKALKEHRDNIGWKLENMWPLAWALGYEREPTIEASQIDDTVIQEILFEFLPGLDSTIKELLKKSKIRTAEEIIALEYRFYCAHNAVRSAQLGHETVPEGFHPIVHGGAVHERRHALTWCLSPGTAWDETDLST